MELKLTVQCNGYSVMEPSAGYVGSLYASFSLYSFYLPLGSQSPGTRRFNWRSIAVIVKMIE